MQRLLKRVIPEPAAEHLLRIWLKTYFKGPVIDVVSGHNDAAVVGYNAAVSQNRMKCIRMRGQRRSYIPDRGK